MTIIRHTGNATDSLTYHNGRSFSTYDRDNDDDSGNCAEHYKAAWWYKACYYSNLNGIYHNGTSYLGVHWVNLKDGYSLKFTEMKVRATG